MRWFATWLGAMRCRWMVLAAGLLLAGTTAARAVICDGGGNPVKGASYITEYDGMLYFRGSTDTSTSDTQLWRSDGVSAELAPNAGNVLTPSYLAPYNGKLYFAVWNDTRLWQYDPIAGASRAPDAAAQANTPQEMTAYGGNLYYRAANFSTVGIELWKFNGTTQTPIDLRSGTGSSYPQHFIEYNGQLYFKSGGSPGPGDELWRTNGTTTEKAATINPQGSSPQNFAVHNGKLYFAANDGIHGNELWQFDSAAGPNGTATLAYDIVPGGQYSSSNPGGLASYNGKLYFAANDGVHGNELWSFDGTNPPQMLPEINPTGDPGNGDTFLMDSSPEHLTVFGGKLYFSAIDGVHGRELWQYDSTTDTASLVADIYPGQYGSEVGELTVYKNQLYFTADNGVTSGLGPLPPQAVMSLAEVPEPGSLALLACGGLALLLWWKRRR